MLTKGLGGCPLRPFDFATLRSGQARIPCLYNPERLCALSTAASSTCRIILDALCSSRGRHSAHHDEVGLVCEVNEIEWMIRSQGERSSGLGCQIRIMMHVHCIVESPACITQNVYEPYPPLLRLHAGLNGMPLAH